MAKQANKGTAVLTMVRVAFEADAAAGGGAGVDLPLLVLDLAGEPLIRRRRRELGLLLPQEGIGILGVPLVVPINDGRLSASHGEAKQNLFPNIKQAEH